MTAPLGVQGDLNALDPNTTGPIRLRALLTALALSPGPVRLPPAPCATVPPEVRWFLAGPTSVELVCDDPITLAHTAGMFTPHHAAVPAARWVVTILRTASLDAAPRAFAGTPLIPVAPDIRAQFHHHDALGDTWWITTPDLIIHNGPRSRWVGIRYTDPAAARSWAPRLVGRLLAARSDGHTR